MTFVNLRNKHLWPLVGREKGGPAFQIDNRDCSGVEYFVPAWITQSWDNLPRVSRSAELVYILISFSDI